MNKINLSEEYYNIIEQIAESIRLFSPTRSMFLNHLEKKIEQARDLKHNHIKE